MMYDSHRLDSYVIQDGGVVWREAMHGERPHWHAKQAIQHGSNRLRSKDGVH